MCLARGWGGDSSYTTWQRVDRHLYGHLQLISRRILKVRNSYLRPRDLSCIEAHPLSRFVKTESGKGSIMPVFCATISTLKVCSAQIMLIVPSKSRSLTLKRGVSFLLHHWLQPVIKVLPRKGVTGCGYNTQPHQRC